MIQIISIRASRYINKGTVEQSIHQKALSNALMPSCPTTATLNFFGDGVDLAFPRVSYTLTIRNQPPAVPISYIINVVPCSLCSLSEHDESYCSFCLQSGIIEVHRIARTFYVVHSAVVSAG
jgi:hypothetical protein